MLINLASNVAFLAQGYDDTGAASRTSIIIGILAFPALVICLVIREKLRDAKNSEQRVESLQKQAPVLANPVPRYKDK
jgi:hypothetical protein